MTNVILNCTTAELGNNNYFVTHSEYYPIYEPAEGGYYYAGKHILTVDVYDTFKKAKRRMRQLRKELNPTWNCPLSHCMSFGENGRYIGEGYIVELTRKPVEERGYEPYC